MAYLDSPFGKAEVAFQNYADTLYVLASILETLADPQTSPKEAGKMFLALPKWLQEIREPIDTLQKLFDELPTPPAHTKLTEVCGRQSSSYCEALLNLGLAIDVKAAVACQLAEPARWSLRDWSRFRTTVDSGIGDIKPQIAAELRQASRVASDGARPPATQKISTTERITARDARLIALHKQHKTHGRWAKLRDIVNADPEFRKLNLDSDIKADACRKIIERKPTRRQKTRITTRTSR